MIDGWLDKTPELIRNACDKHDGKFVPCETDHKNKVATCIDCGHEYPFESNPAYVTPAQPAVGL